MARPRSTCTMFTTWWKPTWLRMYGLSAHVAPALDHFASISCVILDLTCRHTRLFSHTQKTPFDLPGWTSWQRIERNKVHRYFMRAETLGCMLLKLSCHLCTPGALYSNVCHNLFSIDSIWATNESRLAHRRVA